MTTEIPDVTVAPIATAHVAARQWLEGYLIAKDRDDVAVAVRLDPQYSPAANGPAVRVPPGIGDADGGLPSGDVLLKFHCYGANDADAAVLALTVANALHTLTHVKVPTYGVHLVGAHGLQTYASPDPDVNATGGTVGNAPADRYIVTAYLTVGPITAS